MLNIIPIVVLGVSIVAVLLCLSARRGTQALGTALLCLWPGVLTVPDPHWVVLGGPLVGTLALLWTATSGG